MPDTSKATARPWVFSSVYRYLIVAPGHENRRIGFNIDPVRNAEYADLIGKIEPDWLAIAIRREYEALKAVEAAARSLGDALDVYAGFLDGDEDGRTGTPEQLRAAWLTVSDAVGRHDVATAALDAIRKGVQEKDVKGRGE